MQRVILRAALAAFLTLSSSSFRYVSSPYVSCTSHDDLQDTTTTASAREEEEKVAPIFHI